MEDTSPEIQSIFAGAIELPSLEGRAAFLEAECGANVELRRQIEALLRGHDAVVEVLANCSPTTDFMPHSDEPIAERQLPPIDLREALGGLARSTRGARSPISHLPPWSGADS